MEREPTARPGEVGEAGEVRERWKKNVFTVCLSVGVSRDKGSCCVRCERSLEQGQGQVMSDASFRGFTIGTDLGACRHKIIREKQSGAIMVHKSNILQCVQLGLHVFISNVSKC